MRTPGGPTKTRNSGGTGGFLPASPFDLGRLFKAMTAAIRFASREAKARSEAEALALELAEAVAARDRFLDIASHELKTPLTALKLQIQLNERLVRRAGPGALDEEKCEKMFGQYLTQCERLAHLVDDMLDVSRINAGRFVICPRPHSLTSVIREAFQRHDRELKLVRCDVHLDVEEGLEGEFDGPRIEQVFACLISNVVRYAPSSPIRVFARRFADGAVVFVRDYGPGIPAEKLPIIFDRFERAISENEVSGLGLGLHISRAIARAHGGELAVLSEPGAGAEFRLDLPLVRRRS